MMYLLGFIKTVERLTHLRDPHYKTTVCVQMIGSSDCQVESVQLSLYLSDDAIQELENRFIAIENSKELTFHAAVESAIQSALVDYKCNAKKQFIIYE